MSEAEETEQPKETTQQDSQAAAAASNVRYVEVAPPTGWHTMAKAVREADEDKIRDCKEDIDTLLVFAGLYSAVLSAFNIESYTALQPGPNDQIIHLLERIAVQTQSYTINSGTLNSIHPSPPPLPSFTAPLWAVRVNGLWFASLIVSLATASLSMLVKQWLREYFAFDYTGPKERVRSLQYRRPGLKAWKVFELAAILPMLLQLSLGLFFVGLCLFTTNVDERMGLTSVPLVSGWAFIIASTTIAPLFSPRCPYKMPLFKSLMRFTRTKITMNVRRTFLATVSRIVKLVWRGKFLQLNLEVDEEETIVNSNADDVDILLSTDIIMADDNILLVMWNMLKGRSTPDHLLAFIMELIISRVGAEAEYLRPVRLRSIPDLSALSRKTWDTFMEMLVDLIGIHHSGGPLLVTSPDWLHKATLLLLSNSPYPLSPPTIKYLRDLVATFYPKDLDAAEAIASWISPHADEGPFIPFPLFQRFCAVYEDGHTGDYLTAQSICFTYSVFLSACLSLTHSQNPDSLFGFLMKHPEVFMQIKARAILDDMWQLLDYLITKTFDPIDIFEALAVQLAYADDIHRRDIAVSSLATTWARLRNSYAAVFPLTRMAQSRLEPHDLRERMINLGIDAFSHSSDREAIIYNSTVAVTHFTQDGFSKLFQMDVVRFCMLHIKIYFSNMDAKHTVSPKHWSDLWAATSDALRHSWDTKSWTTSELLYWFDSLPMLSPDELLIEDRRLAGECLTLIQDEDTFPDLLVSALGLFIAPEDVAAYPRLVRMQAQERLQPKDNFAKGDQSGSASSNPLQSDSRAADTSGPLPTILEERASSHHSEDLAGSDVVQEEPGVATAMTDQVIAVTEQTEDREPADGNSGSLVAAPPMNIAVAGATNAMERGEGIDESKGQPASRSKDDDDGMGVSGEEEHTESAVGGDEIVNL